MNQQTKSELETKQLANNMAVKFKGGEVLALSGELGSGKTTFVQGLAEYFNIADQVSSPTFTLIQEYKIDNEKFPIIKLIHIDCYRLNNEQELINIGIEEYFNDSTSVVVIEWAEKVKPIVPETADWIEFQHGSNINERIIIS